MRKILQRLVFIVAVILLSACNLAPGSTQPTSPAVTAIPQITTVNSHTPLPATATLTSTTVNQTLFPKTSSTPSPRPLSPSPTTMCNRALPGSPIDITVPDDTIFEPGEAFSKTWRLKNAGSCAWTSEYAVIFFSGDSFGASHTIQLSGPVLPGNTVDLTIDMMAPQKAGTYQSNWELSDALGKLFGLGPGGDAPFWVRIVVVAPDTPTPTSLPTLTPTAPPVVYVSGLSNLIPGDTIDLDTNLVNTGENDDLQYDFVNDESHILTPLAGAAISIFGPKAPSYKDCSTAGLATTPITLNQVDQGTYFCYATNLGLPGWVRLVALNTQDNTLTLEILTWAIP